MPDFLNVLLHPVQTIRGMIQQRLGSSGDVVNNSDLNRSMREDGYDNTSNDPDPQLYEKTVGRVISDHFTALFGGGDSAVKGIGNEIDKGMNND